MLGGMEWAHSGALTDLALALPALGALVLERRDLSV